MPTATKKRKSRAKSGANTTWQRLLRLLPGYDPFLQADDCWFEPETAQLYLDFIEECCTHVEGDLAGQLFILEPWEKSVVANFFGWQKIDAYGRQVRRFREALIYVPRKNGKMLALDTPIPTPCGWACIGDLEIGDTVFDENGLPCKVIETSAINPKPESYLLTFSNGEKIKACADHLWQTSARVALPGDKAGGRGKRPQTDIRSTKQLYETQYYGKRQDRNHNIVLTKPLELPEQDLLIDPYVLGCWIGDGDSDSARITIGEQDEKEFKSIFASLGVKLVKHESKNRTSRFRLSGNGEIIQVQLRKLRLLNNKRIPVEYLRSSIPQRQALLQGLMDTDGTISKSGQCIEFVTAKRVLAENFTELLSSLGIKNTIRTDNSKINGKIVGIKHRIQFTTFLDDFPVFRLKRKLDRMLNSGHCKTANRCKSIQIASVDPIDPEPMKCIAVDSPSHLYLCSKSMIPTHNTPLAAAIINAAFFLDDEKGQQDYCAAGEVDQATLSFRHIDGMQQNEIEMSSQVKTYKSTRTIMREEDQSFIKVLSRDANTKHGGNPHIVLVDELHVQPNRRLVDVFSTAMSSMNRKQSFIMYLTTADYKRESICNEKYEEACRVRDNKGDKNKPGYNPTFLPVIYEASQDDDWTKLSTWKKANPNLNVSKSVDYMRKECRKAQDTPTYENTFKRLDLNIQTDQDILWIPSQLWDGCNFTFNENTMVGRRCFAGFDLSNNTDTAGYGLLFPPDPELPEGDTGRNKWIIIPRIFVPKDNAEKREDRDEAPYITWGRQGYITLTDGDVIDYETIRASFWRDAERFNIQRIAFDKWSFEGERQRFIKEGIPEDKFVSFGQNYYSMSAPSKELERILLARVLAHGGHPVLGWMAANVTVEIDHSPSSNIKPVKRESKGRIDGIVMIIMALGEAMKAAEEKVSVYENRGIFTLGG